MSNKVNPKVSKVLEVVARLGGEANVERIMQRNAKGHYTGSYMAVKVTGHAVRDQWSRQYLKNKISDVASMERMVRGSGVAVFKI